MSSSFATRCHEIASRVAYLGETLEIAADRVIMHNLAGYGIGAGIVALDAEGKITAPYKGMFRGWITQDGELSVATNGDVLSMAL